MRRIGIPAGVFAILGPVLVLTFVTTRPAQPAGQDASDIQVGPLPWGGDRTLPVHLLPLRDEDNALIVPTETNPMPFSARWTCGPCHDYATVASGWHFQGPSAEAAGRPGEPWIWTDRLTGTALPLSYRRWAGTWDPAAVGLSPWQFTALFGRHMAGAGPGEPAGALTEPGSRWNVSGILEANCLACHNASRRQDHSEWAKQVLRENYRWAATAASGLGEVGGMASRLKETWDVHDGPNPDDHEWAVVPEVAYKRSEFDSKHRVFFDLNHQADDARCLACHSVTPAAAEKAMTDRDVHAVAGLKCADCHRNGLDHRMLRGYEGEAKEKGVRTAASFTCRGCHLGEDAEGGQVVPGRLGAPLPAHKGIPLVHFKRLSCTVCHSGPKPGRAPERVRTSRANRLGIHGAAQWWTDSPAVLEPVFTRGEDDKIAPHRLTWPAFWARLDGEKLAPLKPADVEAAAGDILKVENRLATSLGALGLALDEGETAVLAAGSKTLEVNVDGGLDVVGRDPKAVEAAGGSCWGVRKNGGVTAFFKDFDPAAADKDPALEERIRKALESLAALAVRPGEPAVVVRTSLYRLSNGVMETAEAPAGAAAGPGRLKDGRLEPLASAFDLRTIAATAGEEESLTEEQVAAVLAALAAGPAAPGQDGTAFGYVSGGRLFRLDRQGKLVSGKHAAAEPVTWPLAHDVRPAQQALGWKGCGDCHSADADFFFGGVAGRGPLLTGRVEKRSAVSLMRVGGVHQRLFGLTFAVRPLLKFVLGACGFVLGGLLLIAFLAFMGRWSGMTERR